jgi:hypothetical protein
MKKNVFAVSVLSAALFLAACEGDDGANGIDGVDGADGADGADGFNSLIAFRDIPKGDAACLGGGRAVDSGLDTNRNDVLDASEVTATEIVECAATPVLRALHASPDAPAVNIWVDGVPALEGVDYTMGSGFVPMAEENNIQVEAIIPGVATEDRIVIDADLEFDYSTETTVIATRSLAGNGGVPFPLIITNPSDERIQEGYFRAQVVHASPSAPGVDVYVTTPGADLGGSAPVNGADNPLEFEDYTMERIEAPADTYQIRITPDNDTDTIFFDSGPLPLPAGADLMIVAVENTGPGATPVQLVVLDGKTASMLYDTNTPASVVAAHLSPDAPAVDLLADATATPEDDMVTLVENVSFLGFCDISVPVPGESAEYVINVALNDGGSVVYSFDPLSFAKGDEALAIVSGFALGGDPVLTDITLPGNTRSVLTETKLRITHSSPITPAVDLKIVGRDAGFDGEAVAMFEGVVFGQDTTQLSVPVGNYDAYVSLPGAVAPAISIEGVLDFTGGEVLDVIARDGEAGPELLILDYAGGFLAEDSNVAACPVPGV